MRGSKSEPGVIPLAIYDLFDIIQQVDVPFYHPSGFLGVWCRLLFEYHVVQYILFYY